MRRYLLTLLAVGLWPTLTFAQTATQVVEYYHTDALGSVRAVTKVVNGQTQVVSRHDYRPFGEEVAPQNPPVDKRLFTGKERDAETGLDYFGARYLSCMSGRFVTADPLTASQKTTNPQTFGRYAYALNNPLRFMDPDGLQASQACAANPKCAIEIRMRVLWDAGADQGTGLTAEQRRAFEEYLLAKARRDFGNANILLNVTYAEGKLARRELTELGGGFPRIYGTRGDSLNVLVSDVGTSTSAAGTDYKATGQMVIGMFQAAPLWSGVTDRIPFWSTPVLTHEMMHDISGVHRGIPFLYDHADGIATGLAAGWPPTVNQVRQGLTNKPYALDANPEAKKPKK
jgi:RHS repeat-associated protein